MDSVSINSLTPLLDNVDKWIEIAEVLPILVSLELILSADNAVALAVITRDLNNIQLQRTALNVGISIALLLRIVIILMAQIILKYWYLKLVSGIYLLYISINKFIPSSKVDTLDRKLPDDNEGISLAKVIIMISFTDLAFSIDSVTAAVAISDQFILVITGAIIGVVALRFTSDLFISWLDIYSRLEIAGYIIVGFIGIKLVIKTLISSLFFPEYINFVIMFFILIWGFSKKSNEIRVEG